MFGLLVEANRAPETDSATFSMIIVGYLLSYLGITRLLVMPLSHRYGRMLSIPVGTIVVVMGIASVLPIILTVIFTGSPAFNYTPLEAIDWAWTMVEAFDQPTGVPRHAGEANLALSLRSRDELVPFGIVQTRDSVHRVVEVDIDSIGLQAAQ